MIDVRVSIHNRDRKISAMVKALAFEVSGPPSVVGASKEFLEQNGYLMFHFPSREKVTEFQEDLGEYLPGLLASIMSP